MTMTIKAAARLLLDNDNIVILTHKRPDGDTLGCGFALLHALEKCGKKARVECADPFPAHYGFICGGYAPTSFEAGFVVAVDVSDVTLLGAVAERYPRVDLCIDHHPTNSRYAVHTLLDSGAAAASQLMYRVILAMGLRPDRPISNALFTGITSDTGCFRFGNTTASTHRIAGKLIDCGAEHALINNKLFGKKSRGRIGVERLIMDSLEFHFDGRCALVVLPSGLEERFGVDEAELEGISSLGRSVEGVVAAATVRTNKDGSFRVSMRTGEPAEALRICAELGGGGHKRAAGCTMAGTPDEVRTRLLSAIGRELERCGC